MKQAILKLEVPDDFEKGDGWKCPYAIDIGFGGSIFDEIIEATRTCNLNHEHCDKENCPLEVETQYDTTEFSEREIAQMKAGHVISHRPKEEIR